jgi:hypothetical protein
MVFGSSTEITFSAVFYVMLELVDSRRYILHVALQSGETHRSYRSSADDVAIEALRPILGKDGEHLLPNVAEHRVWITRSGRLLLATVWADVPLCTFAVADQIVGADRLWQMVHEDTQTVTHADRSPPPPWCAVRREAGLVGHPQDKSWLAEFEHNLAWAWLEIKASPAKGR